MSPTAAALPGSVAFEDVRRPLSLFLRGILRNDVAVHAAPAGASRAFGDEAGLFFPQSFPMYGAALARTTYLAAAAHLAAHTLFGALRSRRGGLEAIQVVLISTLEDARVEKLLQRELPGVSALWRPMHRAIPAEHPTFVSIVARIARALCDESYRDGHALVRRARAFFDGSGGLPTSRACREFGGLLGNDIGQMRLQFNERDYRVEPPYRDDHRWLWERPSSDVRPFEWLEVQSGGQTQPSPSEKTPTNVSPIERKPKGRQSAGVATVEEGKASGPARAAIARSIQYPEWDYVIQRNRPSFCTVHERRFGLPISKAGSPGPNQYSLDDYREPSVVWRIDRLARSLKVAVYQRSRRQPDGYALDLDAAIDFQIDRRARRCSNEHVYTRAGKRSQTAKALLLLDLSRSIGDAITGAHRTRLDVVRDTSALMGRLLARASARFAIHGFSSDGRRQVDYLCVKEFDEAWDAAVRARLRALAPRQSTRLGAALRHATWSIGSARDERRVLLLLTDGEPSDIDAHDPKYLLFDAQRAVIEARRRGVTVFAVCVEPGAHASMKQIFGNGNFLTLDRAERLPELLPKIYARLASLRV